MNATASASPARSEPAVRCPGPARPGHRIALIFNLNALFYWIGSVRDTSVGVVSKGEFSAVRVRGILAVLARHAVRATFFVSGHTALAYPREVSAIQAATRSLTTGSSTNRCRCSLRESNAWSRQKDRRSRGSRCWRG